MQKRNTLTWVPTLYFAEGLPYVIVTVISVIMYKRLGLDNEDVAFYTSWLYLPWVIKPFWSPIVDMLKHNRWWILSMQVLIGAALAGVALTINLPDFVRWTMCFFWLLAFSSATHDIAADGFYMVAQTEHEQAQNVGVRSTFYRISTILGQGALVVLAGQLEVFTQNPKLAWMVSIGVAAGLMLLLWSYHKFMLPRCEEDKPGLSSSAEALRDFLDEFGDFFAKKGVMVAIIFMLIYRLPEALLVKITPLFLLDSVENGGLGLTTSMLGFVQGTIGVVGLITGGILGGLAIARDGFQRWLWPMVLAMSIPNMVYVGLAYYQPEQMWFFTESFLLSKEVIVGVCYFLEQFGYGFGFTAYMVFMLYFSQGPSRTAHYAFCTGFMALSMMLPGLVAGQLQDYLGYYEFFVVVLALMPLTFIAASIIKVNPKFGKK